MRLASVRLRNVGPFDDTTVRFVAEDAGEDSQPPRAVTVLFGGDGTGKTSLLAAIGLTRPGYALPPLPSSRERNEGDGAFVVTEWMLGEDDPERPHPLVVTSPTVVLPGEAPEVAAIRRREQALFDKRAQQEGGFVFMAFSGARWFSRSASVLTTPERSVLRYDVRHPVSFDDPTRADLTRETKQALVYAAVADALGRGRAETMFLSHFDEAMREVATIVLEPFGFIYAGVGATTLEPEARDSGSGRLVPFDALPRAARHLLAFVVLPLRALFAAYPGSESPREHEGVVAIDDIEIQQDPTFLRAIVPLLRRALPNVQWILATSSTQLALACEAGEVVALRRLGARVEASEEVLQ
jgi:hypothetical protein